LTNVAGYPIEVSIAVEIGHGYGACFVLTGAKRNSMVKASPTGVEENNVLLGVAIG
jgi:hypothetical protein